MFRASYSPFLPTTPLRLGHISHNALHCVSLYPLLPFPSVPWLSLATLKVTCTSSVFWDSVQVCTFRSPRFLPYSGPGSTFQGHFWLPGQNTLLLDTHTSCAFSSGVHVCHYFFPPHLSPIVNKICDHCLLTAPPAWHCAWHIEGVPEWITKDSMPICCMDE